MHSQAVDTAWACSAAAEGKPARATDGLLCMPAQARLWQVGKLMPQKLAKHMEVSAR